jgi:hypothetical protein
MANCIEEIRGQACVPIRLRFTSPTCMGAIEPRVAIGASCAEDYECTSLLCDRPRLTEAVCIEKKANGGDCVSDDDCTSANCADFKCALPGPPDTLCDG